MGEMRRSLLGVSPEELGAWMAERGHRPYHARQVYRWIFERRLEGFEGMSDVPKRLREELEADWSVFSTRVATHHASPDGTDKLLLECVDGRRVECVLMAEADRRTVCISTQVGCGMGCVFCASGLRGVERNLTRGEIVEQVIRLRNLLPADGAADQSGGHGDGREPGQPRQSDPRARLDLLERRAGAGPAAGDDLDGGIAREDAEARRDGAVLQSGGLVACADGGVAKQSSCRSTRRLV